MTTNSRSTELDLLLYLIDQAYEKRAWHGPNLRFSLRGLNAKLASRRPAPGRHNIWEIVVHLAYWKYIVTKRLLDVRKGTFPYKGRNWFLRPSTTLGGTWESDLRLLDETHRAMRDVVANMRIGQLGKKTAGKNVTNTDMISGIAAHDFYHAAQIQLVKRLLR